MNIICNYELKLVLTMDHPTQTNLTAALKYILSEHCPSELNCFPKFKTGNNYVVYETARRNVF